MLLYEKENTFIGNQRKPKKLNKWNASLSMDTQMLKSTHQMENGSKPGGNLQDHEMKKINKID